jgi:hypothetical protein
MIQIKPLEENNAIDLRTGKKHRADSLLWQGIHVCSVVNEGPSPRYVTDLPIGHSAHWAYQIDLLDQKISGPSGIEWLSRPFLESLLSPNTREVTITRQVFKKSQHVIILNCLDMMYGHSLLKLLNASRHIEDHPDRGLIILIPEFLRWLVPDGVAEIWSVPLSLSAMKNFYPALDHQIQDFCTGFESIWLSEAFSHPSRFRIQDYTGIHPHSFDRSENLVTFIWREDRLWLPHYHAKKLRKLGFQQVALAWQRRKIITLFKSIRSHYPETRFAVTGLGKSKSFPSWIHDLRVQRFDEDSEKEVALLCADSRIVIGIHGSNMLLPSGLAGMTIDLMPDDKWQCLPEDILFQEADPRLATFRYRFIPATTSPKSVASVVSSMLMQFVIIPSFLNEEMYRDL